MNIVYMFRTEADQKGLLYSIYYDGTLSFYIRWRDKGAFLGY